MKWDFNISEEFSTVRDLIEDETETVEQCVSILDALRECCHTLTPYSERDWGFYTDFMDLKEEIDEEVECMDKDDDYNVCETTVNYYLNEFYDLCDNARVWLGI